MHYQRKYLTYEMQMVFYWAAFEVLRTVYTYNMVLVVLRSMQVLR
jgi:hypothetical protein